MTEKPIPKLIKVAEANDALLMGKSNDGSPEYFVGDGEKALAALVSVAAPNRFVPCANEPGWR